MSYAHISQTEARGYRAQLEAMQRAESDRKSTWSREWPMGTHIGSMQLVADSALTGAILTSRKLGHAVVVTCDENGKIKFHAMTL